MRNRLLVMTVLYAVVALLRAAGFPGNDNIKVLNNLVSELVNAKERGLLGAKEIEFVTPGDGWCFFALSGDASITLNNDGKPLAVAKAGAKQVEAMRYLSAGRHSLYISGKISSLIVRAIPEIQYTDFPVSPQLKEYGKYDWDYLDRIGMLSNLN